MASLAVQRTVADGTVLVVALILWFVPKTVAVRNPILLLILAPLMLPVVPFGVRGRLQAAAEACSSGGMGSLSRSSLLDSSQSGVVCLRGGDQRWRTSCGQAHG